MTGPSGREPSLHGDTPALWVPLTSPYTLFDVEPPSDHNPTDPDTAADLEWYRLLRRITARSVLHLVTETSYSYRDYRGPRLAGRAVGALFGYHKIIALDCLRVGGFEVGIRELQPPEVGDLLSRLAKTFGLLVHDQDQGARYGWLYAPQPLDFNGALEVVEQAFQGKWPTPPAGTPFLAPQP